MNLFTGHPTDIKDAFLNFIKEQKQNPFDKALVILPAQRLQSVLKREAAQKMGYLSAVYFSDFLRLALDINAAAQAPFKPLLPDTYKHDFIIKNILQKYSYSLSRNYITALKSAFRDMAGALITTRDIITIKNESEDLTPDQKNYLAQLAVFYNDYLKSIETDRFNTYYQTFEEAAKNAQDSPYLTQFKQIIFYGFYDFTAVQFELLKNIAERFDITMFFPYENLPAYKFIQNFYESNILGRAKKTIKVPPQTTPVRTLAQGLFDTKTQPAPCDSIKVISVSGAAAEIESAAKEILRLKEDLNIDFKDIALTARSLENYKEDILDILEQNKIPCQTSFDMPLVQEPLGAFVLNLLSLAKNNFYREDVLSVITSPYFKDRDDAWPSIIKNIGVSAGYRQWQDLLPLAKNQEAAQKLAKFLEEIKIILTKLESAAPFETLCQSAAEVLKRYTQTQGLSTSEENILFIINNLFTQIESFKEIRQNAEKGEFLEEFSALLKEQKTAKAASCQNGVSVADIMALRGQSFKAVIIMGLNEGSLPASPKEDPVLKDVYRKMFQNLGHLIHRQSDRYDEEKILYYFALSCASDYACLIYQRSGESGKPKIPSLYLTQTLALTGQDLNNNNNFILSRRPAEKYLQWPFKLLNQREAALTAGMLSKNKSAAIAQIMQLDSNSPLAAQFEAATVLNSSHTLTPYDAVVEQANIIYQEVITRGISPSDLQILFRCPARYLFEKITYKEEDTPFERGAISPLKKGTLYHKILEDFYKDIKNKKLFASLFASGAKDILKTFLDIYLDKENYKTYGMYPLLWEMQTAKMAAYLNNFVEQDLKIIQETGFIPELFEDKQEVALTLNQTALKLRGKIDRIDISADGGSYKIADYKTKKESAEIKRAIFANSLLQPPLYFEMAKNMPVLKGKTPALMSLLAIETQGTINKDLPYDMYLGFKQKFTDMIEYLLTLVKDGTFIINPNETNCKNCRFEAVCRKAHHPTARRSKISNQAKTLRDYHAT